jgi:hypothetical protein
MHAGLVPGLEIEEAVRLWPAVLELGSAIQISRVDSAAPGALGALDDAWRSRYEASPVGADVVVPVPAFRRLLGEGFFQGFDEIWLLDGGARAPRPPELVLTSDHPVERVPAESWREWLIAGGARLGLGDGAGLNSVAGDATVAHRLAGLG